MLCPNCNQEIPDKSKYCIKCGQRIRQSKPQSQKDASSDESYRLLSPIVTSGPGGVSTEEMIASLLKRGRLFLEDCDWKTANAYFDRVLDLNPESAHAYIGKLCAEQKVSTEDTLADLSEPLDENSNYKKALRFADVAYKATINEYNQAILSRIEAEQKEKAYLSAKHDLDIVRYGDKSVDNSGMLHNTANEFRKISGYKDADELAIECEAWAEKLEQEAEEIRQKIEQERIEQEKKDEIAHKRNKKITLIVVPLLSLALLTIGILKIVVFPALDYNKAVALFEAGEFDAAVAAFEEMGDYKDAADRIPEIYYAQGEALFATQAYTDAIAVFKSIRDYRDAANRILEIYHAQGDALLADNDFEGAREAFKLAKDDTAIHNAIVAEAEQLAAKVNRRAAAQFCFEINEIELGLQYDDPSKWVVAGSRHTVGLWADGTVGAVGSNEYGQCEVNNWNSIIAISAGGEHTVGLRADGTVVAAGSNYNGECNVDNWTDIIAVSAGGSHTVGLRSNGTVAAVGGNWLTSAQCDVDNWTDIIAVSAGGSHTVGLRTNGTVIAVGYNAYGQCNVDNWVDIVAISAGSDFTVGLQADGTVIATGSNDFGQCEISDWKNIVSISAWAYHTVGVTANGRTIAVGGNNSGECNTTNWEDIIAISAGVNHTVGLRANGYVVTVGSNEYGQRGLNYWNLFSAAPATPTSKASPTNQPTFLDDYTDVWTVDHKSIEYPTEVHLSIYKEDGNYYTDCDYAVVPYFPGTIFGTLMEIERIPLSLDRGVAKGHYDHDNWGATGDIIISSSNDKLIVTITGEPTEDYFGNYTMGLDSAQFVRDNKSVEQKTALTYLGLTVDELSEVMGVEIIDDVQMAEGARYINGKDIPLTFYLDRYDFDPLTGDETVIAIGVWENGYADGIFSGFLPPEYVENRIIDSGFDYTASDEVYGDPGIAYDIDCGNYSITYVWEEGGTHLNYLMVRAK